MHEATIISPAHVLLVDGPAHILAQNLTILCWVFYAWAAPVLGINEVCTFQSLLLVVLHLGIAYELRVELITFRMGYYEINISCIHPLGE